MNSRLASLLVFFVVLAVASPARVHAQGIGISWNNCVTLTGSAENVDYACDGSRDGDPYRIVVTFQSPESLRAFVGIEIGITLVTDAPTLPDFWQVAAGPSCVNCAPCRLGGMVFPANMTGIGTGATGACRNPWLGGSLGGGFVLEPAGRPGWGSLRFALARETPTTLSAGQRYLAGVIDLDPVEDVGSGVCTGCQVPAALELNFVTLYQEPGTPPQDYFLLSGFADVRNRIRWQNCSGCYTPTRNTTWGAVKATYR